MRLTLQNSLFKMCGKLERKVNIWYPYLKTKYLQLIVNGSLGPCGPHAPKLVTLDLKHDPDLKVKMNYMVEYVQDQQGTREVVRWSLVQVNSLLFLILNWSKLIPHWCDFVYHIWNSCIQPLEKSYICHKIFSKIAHLLTQHVLAWILPNFL